MKGACFLAASFYASGLAFAFTDVRPFTRAECAALMFAMGIFLTLGILRTGAQRRGLIP